MLCTLKCISSIALTKLKQSLRNICLYNSFVTIIYLFITFFSFTGNYKTNSEVSSFKGISETNNRSTGCSKCFPSQSVLLQRKQFLLFPYFNLENNVPFSASRADLMAGFLCKEGNGCSECKT